MSYVFLFVAAVCAALTAWQVPYMLHGHVLNFVSFGWCLVFAIFNLAKAIRQ